MQELKLGYPYSYGDELTPEMARSNRNKMLTLLLLIWLLKVSEVQATPLLGADGFTPTYICRKRQTYSREGMFKKIEVTHYFHPETGFDVFFNRDNNKFISGWLLKDDQLDNIVNRGAL